METKPMESDGSVESPQIDKDLAEIYAVGRVGLGALDPSFDRNHWKAWDRVESAARLGALVDTMSFKAMPIIELRQIRAAFLDMIQTSPENAVSSLSSFCLVTMILGEKAEDIPELPASLIPAINTGLQFLQVFWDAVLSPEPIGDSIGNPVSSKTV